MAKTKNTNESQAGKAAAGRRKRGASKTDTVNLTGKTDISTAGVASAVAKPGAAKAAKSAPAVKLSAAGKKNVPVILITNDDGVSAPGIRNLVEAVKDLGKVVVVAPDKPQSGMGHAITIGNPLRLHQVQLFDDVEAWQCSGTPVDCVKLAVDKILHRKPDLCLSGINHGANHSINVIYSGTMSAAVEAAIESIPSVGFSLLDYSVEADFSAARKYVRIIVKNLLKASLDKHLILNVNFPALPDSLIKGMKICRQAYAKYEEDFLERNDPTGKKYYWLTGKFVNFDKGRDTDVWALENNYVSVVPVQFDMTNYVLKGKLEKTWKS
ncbi:MAG TPA: 5'/3'-nucleotidase SurE [Puia sp.]|nr:5'/3'-nucleotidase SurE [Puia sp.]